MGKIKNIQKYFQPQIGNTENIVSIFPIEHIETVLDSKSFIKV